MLYGRVGFVLVVGLVAGLAGCKQGEDAAVAQVAAVPAKASPAEVAGPVSVDPAELTSCVVGSVVTVRWDLRPTHPNVADVEIFTGQPGKETIFAAGGFAGEAATGPWARPGTTFLVRNKADGTEVAKAVVGGPTCD